jgi:PAS domain S-box-containing protein
MIEIFRMITPITYWVLIVLWSFILYFYVKKMWDSKTKQLFHALVIILAIDAFRTLFESFYFGLWYTSLSGLIPIQIGNFLTRPELVIIPKIINVVAAVIIIVLLIKRWLPSEEQEQNRLGAVLHDSEEEFRVFFENNPVSCWLEDLSEVQKQFEELHKKGISDLGIYIDEYPEELVKFAQAIEIKDVNQATLDLHKAESKEQLFQGLEKTFTPESFKVFKKEMVDLWNGKIQNSYDGVVKTLDDEFRYVQVNYKILPGYESTLEKVLISLVDNTSKWLIEQKLLASENRFDLAMQFTNDGLWDWNLETNEIWFSPAWKSMLGYKPDELENDSSVWERLTHPDDVKTSWNMLREVIDRKRPRFELEFKMQHKKGNWVDILSRSNVVFAEEGKAVRVVGTHVDISERKKAEEELSGQKKLFETMFNTIPDGVVITNTNREIQLANIGMEDTFGYKPDEILGKSTEMLYAKKDNFHQTGVALFGEKSQEQDGRYITYYQNNNGLEFPGETFGAKLFDKKNRWLGNLGIIRDITERLRQEEEGKMLQKQLSQAQKMEAIGTLAGGIAHDFNNILSAIVGYTEMARDDSPSESSVATDLDNVLEASTRAVGLVKQILSFSRQDETEYILLQPASIVTKAVTLLRPSLPTTIEISQDIDTKTGLIFGDPTQIHQILINLCTNAFHAMEDTGGRLDLSLKEIDLCREDFTPDLPLAPGTFIQLSVGDSGAGMTQQVKDKIFDPYFTTKGVGKGTGMGLSIVHGIIKSYGGFITLTSELGKGTVFHVFLPVVNKEELPARDATEQIPIGIERVLFIDDEDVLADMGKTMLERLGYHVTVRKSSLEALETFQNQPDQFDVVITDQTMPGMTGIDLARRMLQIRPDIPIILCTGYSSIISEEKAKSMGVREFALKPVGKRDIAMLIRKVLNGNQE